MYRIALAFLIASALGTAVSLAPVLTAGKDLMAFFLVVGYALLGVLPAAIVVGAPLLYMLQRLKLLTAWQFILAGAGAWSLGIAVASSFGTAPHHSSGLLLSLAAVLLSFAVFWLIAIRSESLRLHM